MTANEKVTHERCETCVKVRATSRHLRRAAFQAAFSTVPVKNSLWNSEVKIIVGARTRGETFAKLTHRSSAKIEDLELFQNVLQTRHRNIPVFGDQDECLHEVAHCSSGMPTGRTAVEQNQANGRAEQRARALRERRRNFVKRTGAEIIFVHSVAQSDVCLSSGGTIKISRPRGTHWRKNTEHCGWIPGASFGA